ncbi:MAG: alpha-amylase family glycosyl hydrolase, partial [Myxococcota bacterium]
RATSALFLACLWIGGCRHDPAADPMPPSNETLDAGSTDGSMPPSSNLPQAKDGWWRSAVFYEIFVRSFKDSDGDGVGDFAGLTQMLDYLNDGDPATTNDLGVDALWLMPIQASPSYHGYDVTDYKAVNTDYGDIADFDRLIEEAHSRGIKVIIDFVLNHSSSQHPWFRQSRSPNSKFRDYYTWRDEPDARWRRPWDGANVWHSSPTGYYYGIFWSGMPDLNLANPEVEAHMIDAMRFWLDRGVDGFRVDAVRYLMQTEDGKLADIPQTHDFAKNVRQQLADYPDAVWVAEAWTDVSRVADYYGDNGNEFSLAFSFDVAGAIKSSINDGNRANLNQTLELSDRFMPDRGFEAPFLSNHDMQRVMREIGGNTAAMRVAAALLMAMPGTPFLYYGEEIGMQGGASSRDEDKRTPMRWTAQGPGFGFTTADRPWHPGQEADGISVAAQRNQPDSLWSLYRDLIALRHEHAALADGDSSRPAITDGDRGVLAILRTVGEQRVLVLANVHRDAAGPFTVAIDGTPSILMQEGLQGEVTVQNDQLRIDGLAGRGFAFIRL